MANKQMQGQSASTCRLVGHRELQVPTLWRSFHSTQTARGKELTKPSPRELTAHTLLVLVQTGITTTTLGSVY